VCGQSVDLSKAERCLSARRSRLPESQTVVRRSENRSRTGWVPIDPALSILIAGMIVWTAWDIFRDSMNILLEGLPKGLTLADVSCAIREVPGVIDVHDLHVWSLGSEAHALSCHVLIEDVPPSASDIILRSLNALLDQRYGIAHTTVQFEHVSCAISESGCAIPVNVPHEHPHTHTH